MLSSISAAHEGLGLVEWDCAPICVAAVLRMHIVHLALSRLQGASLISRRGFIRII